MSVMSKITTMLNSKVMSKSEALGVIDSVRAEIEDGDDTVTVGEALSIFIKLTGASMSWVATAFGLFGCLCGLIAGYLTL